MMRAISKTESNVYVCGGGGSFKQRAGKKAGKMCHNKQKFKYNMKYLQNELNN